jgi:cytidylate kinase
LAQAAAAEPLDEELLAAVAAAVREYAAKGNCVIVGRGSQIFLAARPDTFRVFLYAPRDNKVRRLLGRGKSEREAQELVDTVDRERAGFIEKYFSVAWPDRAIYHVMLNTALGDENVVQAIVNCMAAFESKSSGAA